MGEISQINVRFGITCPITHMIYRQPVMACDGFIYEEEAIQHWFKTNSTSPVTGAKINKKCIPVFLLRTAIVDYLRENPADLENQYTTQIDMFIRDLTHIEDGIACCNYDMKFLLTAKYEEEILLFYILKNYHTPVIKHIINNAINLEYSASNGWRLIHYICQHSTLDVLECIVEKGVNLECKLPNEWRPIHQVCRYSPPEMIRYMIDKGVNLECATSGGWSPIHYVCRYSTPEIMRYMIDKGVNLECVTPNGWRPIHYVCRYSTLEIIRYMIDKGVNLECVTGDDVKPTELIKLNQLLFQEEKDALIQLIDTRIANKFPNNIINKFRLLKSQK